MEDNDLVRALEVDLLSSLEYDVTTAGTAEEALQLLSGPRIALLVTDIRIPGCMDGFALARTARHRRPDLKIMLLGADVDHIAPDDLRAVADAGLSKPFLVAEFEECLSDLRRTK